MKFKVGDKVRCIDGNGSSKITVGKEYIVEEICKDCICITDNYGEKNQTYFFTRFELVQEDKLPHELLGLPKYFGVKKDESDPLWGKFYKWFESVFDFPDDLYFEYTYYGYTGPESHVRSYPANGWNNYYGRYEPNIITLAERDRCVNKKQIHTKKLSEKYTYTNQVLRSDGVLFTPDEIGGEKVSDIKERYNKDRSLLRKYKDLFGY